MCPNWGICASGGRTRRPMRKCLHRHANVAIIVAWSVSGKVDATFPVRKRDQQVFKALVLMQSKHEEL
jgi:hypothetical protein